MPRTLQWKDLKLGLVSLGTMLGLVVLILLFAGSGLGARGVTIYAATDEAAGVMKGTEVWLAGQRVGSVRSIQFAPPSTSRSARLVLELKVDKEHLPLLRRDSHAQLRPSGDVIGAEVVAINPGTPAYPQLTPGDTIFTKPGDTDGDFMAQLASTKDDLDSLSANVQALGSDFKKTTEKYKPIAKKLDTLRAEFQALKKDVKRHPLRYINF